MPWLLVIHTCSCWRWLCLVMWDVMRGIGDNYAKDAFWLGFGAYAYVSCCYLVFPIVVLLTSTMCGICGGVHYAMSCSERESGRCQHHTFGIGFWQVSSGSASNRAKLERGQCQCLHEDLPSCSTRCINRGKSTRGDEVSGQLSFWGQGEESPTCESGDALYPKER